MIDLMSHTKQFFFFSTAPFNKVKETVHKRKKRAKDTILVLKKEERERVVRAKEGDRSHQSEQSSITDSQHYKTSSLSRISFHKLTHGRTYRPTSRPITMHAPLSPTLLQYTLSNCIILFFLSFFSFFF